MNDTLKSLGIAEYAFEYNTPYLIDLILAVDPNADIEPDAVAACDGPREYVFRLEDNRWVLDHTWGRFVLSEEINDKAR